jgi:hypothetical protein
LIFRLGVRGVESPQSGTLPFIVKVMSKKKKKALQSH